MPKYNHDNFGDVQDHIFAKGIITKIDTLNDVTDVTVAGYKSGSDVPLFYHCEADSEERDNGAIEGAASAFSIDDEVIVMLEVDGDPVRIVGFVDGIKGCGYHEPFSGDGCLDNFWVYSLSGSGYDRGADSSHSYPTVSAGGVLYCCDESPLEPELFGDGIGSVKFVPVAEDEPDVALKCILQFGPGTGLMHEA